MTTKRKTPKSKADDHATWRMKAMRAIYKLAEEQLDAIVNELGQPEEDAMEIVRSTYLDWQFLLESVMDELAADRGLDEDDEEDDEG
jgi:hypothetical protein